MRDNKQFLEVIRASFKDYLSVNSSRSTAKLKRLHGAIANDLQELFGNQYQIQSQGFGDDREGCIQGRYYPKNVDILIRKDGKPTAGYAIKFITRNYAQNSVNYFENMLGETANIRTNAIPYFQIFILFEKIPHYKAGGAFAKYDVVTEHNLEKYIALSKDDPNIFYHTPDKTLVLLIRLKEKTPDTFRTSKEYADYYLSIINDKKLLAYSKRIDDKFDDSVILNDYADFLERTYHLVLGRHKKKSL